MINMSLRFRQLQAFHAIVETGTVTGAAAQLGISQPGISNLLYQLERQTGLKLFERRRGRLIPTPEAGVLFQEVDTVVRGLDHVAQTVTDLQNKQAGQLQVASQHAASFGFMPALIARFARSRPDMSISFQAQNSLKIQEWVQAGLFEIGLCERPLVHDGLDVHSFDVETRLAIPEHSPLAIHETLTPALLADHPFIVMGREHVTHRRLREVFQQADVPLRTRVQSHLYKNLLSFVQEGMGVSLLDPFTVDFEPAGGFVVRRFRPRIVMEMAVITSRRRPLSAVAESFLKLLKQELDPYAVGAVTGGRAPA